ncbi:DUF3418 domain-containing protein [Boudabousia liubingyangii]|uniref:DUF3418 domain-containing protein n=1 Tax=Boudabousia liubingyangii TaxID=1921764 RepID=UPI000A5F0BA6
MPEGKSADQPLQITYPPQLPVTQRKDEIAQLIRDHQVVVLSGETGSGKTTQLPKICLDLGRGTKGMIGHTQPRRIAARAVADRIAHELHCQLGELVGYQVRFTDQVSEQTRVKLMTDGIMLAEIQGDPLLKRYDTIIIDEAHERSLNIDFLLGYLARLLPMRPDLKLIITSATIDSERFAEHFKDQDGNPAPIIEVSGRTYPVEIRYRPLVPDFDTPDQGTGHAHGTGNPPNAGRHDSQGTSSSGKKPGRKRGGVTVEAEADLMQGIIDACEELFVDGPGDILVFLAGERDIRDADQALKDHLGNRYLNPNQPLPKGVRPDAVEVLPLYARLSAAEQSRVFAPHQFRRIVLATNVAETSLTVPGIRYVVDPGLARISRYSPRTKVQRLPIEPVSQASANQRSGRCGRVADGIAIRLYSEDDFDSRPEFTEPEILRTSLASVILQMSALGLGDVADFPFVDPPDGRAVRSGVQQLLEIGALTEDAKKSLRLTKVGRSLARLPIDPRLGRVLLEAQKLGCASEVGVIVAALSIQDIRERPAEHQGAADEAHARFTDPKSDFITYLNLWRYVRTLARDLSGSAFRRTVRAEFLHYLRIREWQDVYAQLRQLAKPLGIHLQRLEIPTTKQVAEEAAAGGIPNATARACVNLTRAATTTDSDLIHRALLVGFLSNLGNWSEKTKDYEGARGVHFNIWPGSGLAKGRTDWVMAAELVETSRLFARTIARIDVDWVEPVASHLVKRVYSEPFWSRRHGAAMVKEKVMLYGMTLLADRIVPLARLGKSVTLGDVNAAQLAREMFIRHALVEGDWRTFHKFFKRNEEAVAAAQAQAEKLRDPGALATDEERFEFFNGVLPANITGSVNFDRWWRDQKSKTPRLLDYPEDFLLVAQGADEAFPDTWQQGDLTLPLSYEFLPGRSADGVTVRVPLEVLGRLEDRGFEWLVPGLFPELLEQTIRALPKPVRRLLVPAPQGAQRLLPLVAPAGPFPVELIPGWAELTASPAQSTNTANISEGAASGTPEGAASADSPSPDSPSADRSSAGTNEPKASSGNAKAATELDPMAASLARLASADHVRIKDPQALKKLQTQNAQRTSAAAQQDQVEHPQSGPLPYRKAFTQAVKRLVDAEVTKDDWKLVERKLPPHLRPRFQVYASDGRVLGTGPDLKKLQKDLAKEGSRAVRSAVKGAVAQALEQAQRGQGASKSGDAKGSAKGSATGSVPASGNTGAATSPDSPQPPKQIQTRGKGGFSVTGYPGLTLKVEPATDPKRLYPTVEVQVHANAAVRDHHQARAVVAQVLEQVKLADGRISSRWGAAQALALGSAKYASSSAMIADLQWAAAEGLAMRFADLASGRPGGLAQVTDSAALGKLVELVRPKFEDEVYALAQAAAAALREYATLDKTIRSVRAMSLAQVATEVRAHATALLAGNFISRTGAAHLPHLARYLQADRMRLEGAESDLPRDQRLAWEYQQAADLVAEAQEQADQLPAGAEGFAAQAHAKQGFWLLQEFRVSLFAQSLGTAQKVSLKRIRSTLSN